MLKRKILLIILLLSGFFLLINRYWFLENKKLLENEIQLNLEKFVLNTKLKSINLLNSFTLQNLSQEEIDKFIYEISRDKDIKDLKLFIKSKNNTYCEATEKKEISINDDFVNKISKKLENQDVKITKLKKENNNYYEMVFKIPSLFDENYSLLFYALVEFPTMEKKLEDSRNILIIISLLNIFLLIYTVYFLKDYFVKPLDLIMTAIKFKKRVKESEYKGNYTEFDILFEKYNQMYEEIEKNNLSKNKFINDAIHEINTPLTIISTNNSIRDMDFTNGEETSKYSKNIKDAIELLKNTISDVSFYFTNDGKNDYKKENISLNKFLKKRVDQFEIIAKNQKIEFEILELDEFFFDISYIELTRIINNNLSNSIKYSFPNSKVNISLKKLDEKSCEMIFQNFGSKIKNPNDIFDRFYRENNVKGGFGIGLNLVKRICDKYNIKIEVSSNEKNGTIFKYKIRNNTIKHTNIA